MGSTEACATCGKSGDHPTSNCPYTDLIKSPRAAAGGRTAPRVCPACHRAAERSRTDKVAAGSVRVTNLPEETSEQDLNNLFFHFGFIDHLRLSPEDEEGRRRTLIGVVVFKQAEDAQRAVHLIDGYVYGGLVLRVEWAVPYVCARCMRHSETCIRVGNLPVDTSRRDLYVLLVLNGSADAVRRIHLAPDEEEKGAVRKVGVVEFEQREDAGRAVSKLNGHVYGHDVLRVQGPFRPLLDAGIWRNRIGTSHETIEVYMKIVLVLHMKQHGGKKFCNLINGED